jgi:hypothetical protein
VLFEITLLSDNKVPDRNIKKANLRKIVDKLREANGVVNTKVVIFNKIWKNIFFYYFYLL